MRLPKQEQSGVLRAAHATGYPLSDFLRLALRRAVTDVQRGELTPNANPGALWPMESVPGPETGEP